MLESEIMYAIAFDLKGDALEQHYGSSSENAYDLIKKHMEKNGFKRQQGSVYYGDDTVNVVKAIVTVQELSKKYAWFKPAVKDIRILQLLGNDDLKPLL
jgi:virulence-associated protein VapD